MTTLKLFDGIEVEFDSMANEFDIQQLTSDPYTTDVISLTFDQIEQLYTWAASVHEGNNG